MKRDNLIWGVILILAGVAFLLNQLFPALFGWFSWPWILIGLGAVFTVGSLLSRVGGMMIPGLILLGLGGIFIYQSTTGNWESWSYVWALMPVLAGLGMFIGGLYDRELRHVRPVALMMMLVGLILFAVFAGAFGLQLDILRYWPVLLILVGLFVLFQSMRPRKK